MVIEIPDKLKRRDIRFVILEKNWKKPIEPNWNGIESETQYQYDDKILLDALKIGHNYGVLCGFNNLIVIDVDKDGKELEEYIENCLPKTFTIKTWSEEEYKKHYYFRNNEIYLTGLEKENDNGETLHYGEIRGKNFNKNTYTQVVGPNSHAIDKEKNKEGDYFVLRDLNIVDIDIKTLEEIKKKFMSKEIRQADKVKRDSVKFDDLNIESTLNIINLIDISKLKKIRDNCFVGAHPIHGSETGNNFHVDTDKNIWYCFRPEHGGGGIASWIAVKEGLISCEQAKNKLDKETYKKVIKIAELKYGFKNEKKKILPINLIEIELPGSDKLISTFAQQISFVLKDKNTLFYRPDSKDIVEIGKLKIHNTGEEIYNGFIYIKPNRFITLVENYLTPGKYVLNEDTDEFEFKKRSITSELANTLLSSQILQQALPQITRIFTIPIPILYNNELTFPKAGYDERFSSWLPYNAPKISNPNMNIEEAKGILKYILKEFCFESKQDYTNAVAAILTPFLKGLFSKFNIRTPVFFYLANRERAGKDYLAGITGIIYEGEPLEESPINNSEKTKSNNSDELRKKILSAMMMGRKRLHFSNNKGYINNATFEAIATAEKWSDRILGRSEMLTFDNELDLSLSGNVGVSFTPDFANRCKFIRLFLDIEDANSRKFENPDLQTWVRKNRNTILSALYSLVKNWINTGANKGKIPFTSFHEWSEICGGIMESSNYDNPCMPDKEIISVGGDTETSEMKKLFEYCYKVIPEKWIKKSDIKDLLLNNKENDVFCFLDLTSRTDQTRFGLKITKCLGRVFSDIRLEVQDNTLKSFNQLIRFTKERKEKNLNLY